MTSTDSVSSIRIPFNKPCLTGIELGLIGEAADLGQLAGNGTFTRSCHQWLNDKFNTRQSFLTHSGTAALEMASLLAGVEPGDEIIMPSFTFVTTASAFVLRGGIPVFVDIRPDVLNIDEKLIEGAITNKTKAIVPVHYAGVSCDMETICSLAKTKGLFVIEDAAHGVLARCDGKPVGSQGDMAALSFHETKNIIAGEGGALLLNNPELEERAHIVWEKGTNRREFMLGHADKYTWKDLGSSFPPSELTAAFLWGQMQYAEQITAKRVSIWNRYQAAFSELEQKGHITRPIVPERMETNGHIYYLLLGSTPARDELIRYLAERGISAVFHYVPLHSSPAGRKYGRAHGNMSVTDSVSQKLVRLPLWTDLTDAQIDQIVSSVYQFFGRQA